MVPLIQEIEEFTDKIFVLNYSELKLDETKEKDNHHKQKLILDMVGFGAFPRSLKILGLEILCKVL